MAYKAVVFDMDGTLLDTLSDIANSANAVLRKHGFPVHDLEAFRYFVGDGVQALVNRVIPQEYRDEIKIRECIKEFGEIYRKNFNVVTRPYKGIPEMLDRLVESRIRTAILSNKPDDFTNKCVREFLSKWNFEIVLGHNDAIPLKPDPAGAIYIAQKMEIDPDNFVYLGDTGIDMKTAVGADMFPVGALWGFRTKEELIKNGAKALIKKPLDILRLLY